MFNINKKVKIAEEAIAKAFNTDSEDKTEEKTKVAVEEEWIWVDGYKATDKNMCCRGYQYEIGKRFDMPEDAKIELCESGFHLCKNLKDVFRYYEIDKCHRFWKVRALVRKEDSDRYDPVRANSPYGYYTITFTNSGMEHVPYIDKLAAKSIEFVEELTIDEILAASGLDTSEWTYEDKIYAIEQGTELIEERIKIRKLEALGYCHDVAAFIILEGEFNKAYALGCQPDINMDTRLRCIFN